MRNITCAKTSLDREMRTRTRKYGHGARGSWVYIFTTDDFIRGRDVRDGRGAVPTTVRRGRLVFSYPPACHV